MRKRPETVIFSIAVIQHCFISLSLGYSTRSTPLSLPIPPAGPTPSGIWKSSLHSQGNFFNQDVELFRGQTDLSRTTGQSQRSRGSGLYTHSCEQREQGQLSARSPDDAASRKCDCRAVGSKYCRLFNLNSSFVLKREGGYQVLRWTLMKNNLVTYKMPSICLVRGRCHIQILFFFSFIEIQLTYNMMWV